MTGCCSPVVDVESPDQGRLVGLQNQLHLCYSDAEMQRERSRTAVTREVLDR